MAAAGRLYPLGTAWAGSGKSGQAHDSGQVSWPPGLSVLACPGAVAYPGGTSAFCPTCQPPESSSSRGECPGPGGKFFIFCGEGQRQQESE